jgi:hypothetical protein
LLLEDSLPFEARYRFKNDDVALVCRTMRRLASEYFQGMDGVRSGRIGHVDGLALNGIIKNAFRTSLHHAGSCSHRDYDRREELLLMNLRSMFTMA